MDFVDASGTQYQLTEVAETPAKKASAWPWIVGGLAVAGGLVWMASQTSKKTNPVDPGVEALIEEARNPDTEWDRLWELFNRPEVEVRRALLDNPNVCPTDADGKLNTDLLKELAKELPEDVAIHPIFVLHVLVEPNGEMTLVVMKVMERTADVGLMEHVFRTYGPSSVYVRKAMAKNPNAPADLLRLMGNKKTEPDWMVRREVARNPNTPGDTLRTLGNPETESQLWVRRVVARHPDNPVDLLRTLGNKKTESDWGVRQAVAENPSTPEDLLRLLGNEATEPHGWVRESVARNPNTPEDVLRILANKKTEADEDVREAAQKALARRGLA